MISFDEALERIRSVAAAIGTESVPLSQAAGRVLARPVIAAVDSPRSNVSAMDGYAIRDSDLGLSPLRLKLVGESFAGRRWPGTVVPGTCVRIFTGAPLPAGADRVVLQEIVAVDEGLAILREAPGNARHVRARGSDFRAGDELLPLGRFLDPRAIVAAAGADLAEVEVFRRPRVRILSTGDELAEPGAARGREDSIPDSVSFGVAALATRWGAEMSTTMRLPDDLSSMQRSAAAVLDATDLVIVTGGASVGEKDLARAMFEPAGLELIFSKVCMKPGKPVWLGRVGERLILGLPGNPTSALVTARLLLVPLLALVQGRSMDAALQWRSAVLDSPLAPCGERETFHRARLRDRSAEILQFQDSSAQKALASADVLVRQKANSGALQIGEEMPILDF